MVHNSLKSESGITIWDWLMRLGGNGLHVASTVKTR